MHTNARWVQPMFMHPAPPILSCRHPIGAFLSVRPACQAALRAQRLERALELAAMLHSEQTIQGGHAPGLHVLRVASAQRAGAYQAHGLEAVGCVCVLAKGISRGAGAKGERERSWGCTLHGGEVCGQNQS
jgi:hypothetical protein